MWRVVVALLVFVTEAAAGCWSGSDGAGGPSAAEAPASHADWSFGNLGKREASGDELRPWTWKDAEGRKER
jgi:hypothetical protein